MSSFMVFLEIDLNSGIASDAEEKMGFNSSL